MVIELISETKISKGYSTVIPASVRKAIGIKPGDILLWDYDGDELKIIPRKKVNLNNIVGLIKKGGNAVESKKRIQRGAK